jgi:inward rectifier potassium channel
MEHRQTDSPKMAVPRGRHRVQIGEREFVTVGLDDPVWQDLYHHFLTIRWPSFFAIIAAMFLLANTVFAVLYMQGEHAIANQTPAGFWGAFFFSVETLATVGYGDMHPQTLYAHVIATTEIFCGLSGLAVITGLIFNRFSRPHAKILFARHPVVRPLDGVPTLMLRAANARQNVIAEVSARLRLMRLETSQEGYKNRKLHDLKLTRDQHPMFVLGWNLTHIIDASSPLFNETAETMAANESTLILSLEGMDETTAQTMRSREIYGSHMIRWNHRYPDLIEVNERGVNFIDYKKFHDVEPLQGTP